MANQYKNKVVYNGATLIDLSDTTAVQSDVASGKYFYTASGQRVQGTGTMGVNIWGDKNVCFFGDSIGYGYNNNGYSFIDILDEMDIFASVHKNCVSGTTTATLAARLQESQTEASNADIIYCEYQANDITGIKGGTLTLSAIETSIRNSVSAIRSANPTCMIVWMPLTIYHFDKIGGTDITYYKQWASALYPVFAELSINLLPIFDTLVAGHASSDGRHPNTNGHRAIAEIVAQTPLGASDYQTKLLSEWTGGSY